tara:strand:- start:302 stop:4192 length:3891 start_codon:yes stop_codon:yes gene_type:complete
MSSLFQEPIRPFVRKQLRVREAILKQGNKGESRFTSNTVDLSDKNDGSETGRLPAGAFYTYTTSRQCVLRMSSGVDLLPDTEVPEKGKFEGNGVLEGENMAIRYILEGGVPAKNIDFGGIKTAQKDGYKQGPRNGFPGTNKSNFNQVGYGFHYGDPYIRSDAKEDMGIVPMPGIIDAQIQTQGRYGAIRTAKVNFKCHNRRQLEILELLYMRPGYPILLEWGWSTYISDDGTGTIKRQQEFPFIPEFFEGNSTQEFINSIILENKAKTGGNYDGFLGVCKNFEIISRSDGGFDCTTDIMAMGEILEGLKGGDSGFTKKIEDKEYPVTDLEYYLYVLKEYIEGFAVKASGVGVSEVTNASQSETIKSKPTLYPLNVEMHSTFKTIIKYFAELGNKGESERIDKLYTLTPETQQSIEDSNYTGTKTVDRSIKDGVTTSTSGNYKNNDVAEYENSVDELEKYIDSFVLHRGEPLSVEGEEGLEGTKAGYNYVRWDFLVEILNNFIIDKVKDGGSTSASEPIVEISYLEQPLGKPLNERQYSTYSTFQFKKTSNKLFTPGNETPIDLEQLMDMSVDPAICLLPHQIISYKQLGKGENVFGSGKAPEKSIGKIFLNIDYLFNLYKTQEGKNFNLWDYINQIWTDVNVACGGTHDFNIRTELERPHVVTISDYIVQNNQIDPNSIFEFKIQSNDSIVRDFNINSVIPSALSATAAVTAQAKSIESLNNVSFAAINKDIKSRFSKNVEKTISDSTVQRLSNEYTRDINRLMDDILFLRDYKRNMLRGDFIEINEETGAQTNKLAIGYAKRVLNDIEKGVRSVLSRFSENQYEEGSDTSQGPLPEPKYYKGEKKPNFNPPAKSAIIPLQFNALMDGVGGIKIGNVFKVDNTRLPKGYQGDDIAFVTWGESQMITAGQDWTTSIRGQLLSLDLGTEIDEEILDLTYRGIIDEVPETQEYSKESIDRIDEEQSDLDQSLAAIKIGDPLFLKINNSPTAVRNDIFVNNEKGGFDWSDNSIGLFKKGNKGLELGYILDIKPGIATITETERYDEKVLTNHLGEKYVNFKTREVERERRTVWFLIDFYDNALNPSNFDDGAVLRTPVYKHTTYLVDLDGADGKWSDLDDLKKEYQISAERKIGWMRWDTVMDGNPDQVDPDFEDKEIQLSYVQPLPEPFLSVRGVNVYLKKIADRDRYASDPKYAITKIYDDGTFPDDRYVDNGIASFYLFIQHSIENDPNYDHEEIADFIKSNLNAIDINPLTNNNNQYDSDWVSTMVEVKAGEPQRILTGKLKDYLTEIINDEYENY